MRTNVVNQKRLDALALLNTIAAVKNTRQPAPVDWEFAATAQWRKIL